MATPTSPAGRRPCRSSPGRNWWSSAAAADGAPDRRRRPGRRGQLRHHRRGPRQGRRHRPDTGQGRPACGITADLTDREQVDRVRQQLADEHADATLLINAAVLSSLKPFLEYDGASYTPTSNWTGPSSPSPRPSSAAWSKRPRRRHRPHRQYVGPPGHAATPSIGYSAAKADCAPSPTTWPSSSPPPHPGQRGRSGRRRRPDLREVRPP